MRCAASFAFVGEGEDPQTDGKPKCGTLRYGPFEIATDAEGSPVELGAGAMGKTYRATDTVLQSQVALKVIDRTLAANPSVRARFLREARAAAMLRHPNIASVSHYGEEDGECYYVMELVEGETLEARVRREGALPPGLVLEIGTQIARALAAAEAQGIVHRDLKPTNVMLAGASGHREAGEPLLIKVIDFGLAKAVTATQIPGLADTRGAFVGTPAFASPEQFAPAADERVDTRADIYSLGVTLWYLLCGKLPFVGRTLTEIHDQQTHQPLPLEHLKAAHVPAPVVSLLRVMLAVSPGQRPQSARELLALLTACQTRLQVGRRTTRPAFRWAAVAVFCLAAAVVWIWRRNVVVPAVRVDTSLAVLPFQNLSPAKDDAFFTRGTHDALAANLGRIERLRLTGPSSVKQYPADKARDLPAIAQALGVAHLLEGSVRRENERVRLDLRLTDAEDPTLNWATQYDRPLAEEFSLLSEITRTVAERLRVPPSEAETALINLRPTQDPGAWDLYLRSKEHPGVYSDEIELRKSCYHKIALLDEAAARDPNFVLAWCALVAVLDDVVTHPRLATPEELSVDHRAQAGAALARARRLAPDSGDVHLAYANHCLQALGNYERARSEVELARRTYPNNSTVEDIAGRVAERQGRWKDATLNLEKAVALDPRNLSLHAHCEEVEEAVRNYPAAIRERTVMGTLLPAGALPSLNLGTALLAVEERADLAPLRAALADVKDAQDNDHEIRDTFGLILAVCEHDESQLRYALAATGRDSFAVAAFPHPKSWYEGLAARMRKDDAAARTAFTSARAVVEKNVAADPADERSLLLLAMIDAGLGRKDEAVQEARRACAMPPLERERIVEPSDRCCLAVVYAWTDQRDLTFQELDKLISGPAGANMPNQVTFGDFQLNPVWDPLRDDPRFAALVARLAPAATH